MQAAKSGNEFAYIAKLQAEKPEDMKAMVMTAIKRVVELKIRTGWGIDKFWVLTK